MMDADHDIKFTPSDFRRVRDMIYQRVGISLNETKTHMAYARLAKRVRARGLARFAEYLDLLQQDEKADEWQSFINALTTNLTFFFREPHHFDMLREHALRHCARGKVYRVWSAASSTGEEPYSIAMILSELFGGEGDCRFEVWASDIDTSVLQQASQGIYAQERTDKMSPVQVRRFFERGTGPNQGKVRVKRAVREKVNFFQLNLVASGWPGLGQFDVIFCRNVLIYFDKQTQASLLRRLADLLTPDGMLFLGHSENIQHLRTPFVACGRTSYTLETAMRRA